jgi:cyclohexadienyl dehydratase
MTYKKTLLISAMIIASIQPSFAIEKIRICTTGDYPPLTYYNPKTKMYSGFAVTVAKKFATSLNKKAIFIQTSWASLNDSLKTKCDIAMGGITQTPSRAAIFNLSEHILPDRKAPIFSKQNSSNFMSFSAIDKIDVTIIENKGGTNESYAQTNIKEATIRIVPENEQVYACLNKYPERKYVMFTDNIEIAYRSSIDRSILSAKGLAFGNMPNNPISYKVYMTNKTPRGKLLITEMDKFHQKNLNNFQLWYQKSLHTTYPESKIQCLIQTSP